jgi:outer membrane protein assembly factor BamB
MSRLVGVDMKNGSVLYVSEYNKTKSLIYKCENKLYTQISRKIYEIEPASGKFLWEFDLNVYLHLSASDLEGGKFAGIYYHIDDEIILVAECDKLNFFCIERSTGNVLLHHKFEKGKDASQDAYKITEPVYHQGKIFFSLHAHDAPPVFYVFDIEEDGLKA